MIRSFFDLMALSLALTLLPLFSGFAAQSAYAQSQPPPQDSAQNKSTTQPNANTGEHTSKKSSADQPSPKREAPVKQLPKTKSGVILRPMFPELQKKQLNPMTGEFSSDEKEKPTITSEFSSHQPTQVKPEKKAKAYKPPILITQVTCPGLMTLTCYRYQNKYLVWCGGPIACPMEDITPDNRCTRKTHWLPHLNLSIAKYCQDNGSTAYFPEDKIPQIKPYKPNTS